MHDSEALMFLLTLNIFSLLLIIRFPLHYYRDKPFIKIESTTMV